MFHVRTLELRSRASRPDVAKIVSGVPRCLPPSSSPRPAARCSAPAPPPHPSRSPARPPLARARRAGRRGSSRRSLATRACGEAHQTRKPMPGGLPTPPVPSSGRPTPPASAGPPPLDPRGLPAPGRPSWTRARLPHPRSRSTGQMEASCSGPSPREESAQRSFRLFRNARQQRPIPHHLAGRRAQTLCTSGDRLQAPPRPRGRRAARLTLASLARMEMGRARQPVTRPKASHLRSRPRPTQRPSACMPLLFRRPLAARSFSSCVTVGRAHPRDTGNASRSTRQPATAALPARPSSPRRGRGRPLRRSTPRLATVPGGGARTMPASRVSHRLVRSALGLSPLQGWLAALLRPPPDTSPRSLPTPAGCLQLFRPQ